MRLEQDIRDNLEAAAAALTVPEPGIAPTAHATRGWGRPVAFAGAGAVAAVALIVIPALIIMPSSPSGTTLAPLAGTVTGPTTSVTVPPSTTTPSAPDQLVLADEPVGDYRLLLLADREPTEVEPPVATVRLSMVEAGSDSGVEAVVGEPAGFFWHTVSGPGAVCQLSSIPMDGGTRVAAQILLSPSLGCSEPYVFDLVDGSLSPVSPSAEDVAHLFMVAWMSGSEEAMTSLASPEAVEQAAMIEVDVTSIEAVCEGAAGSVYCNWVTSEGNVAIRVSNVEAPPRVEEVRLEN